MDNDIQDLDGSPTRPIPTNALFGRLRGVQGEVVRDDTEDFVLAGAPHVKLQLRRTDDDEWEKFTKRLVKAKGNIRTEDYVTLLLRGTTAILVLDGDREYKPFEDDDGPILWDGRLAAGAGIAIPESVNKRARATLLAFWSREAEVPLNGLAPLVGSTGGQYLAWLQGHKKDDNDDGDEPEAVGVPGILSDPALVNAGAMVAHGIDPMPYLMSTREGDRCIWLGLLHNAVRTRRDMHQDLANRIANAQHGK